MPMKHLILFQTDPGSGGGGGQGGGDGAPDPGDQGGGSQADDGSGSGGGSDGGSADDADERVKRANSEAAATRKKLRDAEKRIAELEGASQTETEKLTTNVTKLTQDNTTLVAQNRKLMVQVVAGRVGIAQEARADAAALLPEDAVSDWSDESAVEKALRDLVKSKPYLTGRTGGGADGGEGGTRDQPQDMNALIRASAGRG